MESADWLNAFFLITKKNVIFFPLFLCRIMGLYASVVLVIGKFVREFFSGISHTIMFEELPNVDRILKLCTDIFLVRETGELDLEEDMYAKLIFLYRSPETMIKWTREKTQWGDVNLWRRVWALSETLCSCSVGVSSYFIPFTWRSTKQLRTSFTLFTLQPSDTKKTSFS